jgi:hypothetical protein
MSVTLKNPDLPKDATIKLIHNDLQQIATILTTATTSTTKVVFSVFQTGATTFVPNTWTPIHFQAFDFDDHNTFNFSTQRWQPTVAGLYFLSLTCNVSSLTCAGCPSIYKNGMQFSNGPIALASNTLGYNNQMDCLIQMNGTTDYVETYGLLTTSEITNVGTSATKFAGFLIN